MKMSKVFTLTLLAFATVCFAQENKYGATPEEQQKCKEQISLYREFRDQKNYKDAFGPWKLACEICPKSAKTLYTDGVKFYKYFIKSEKDDAKKQALIDSMLLVYDARIENFGQEGLVLGKKGIDMVRFRPDQPKASYSVLAKAIELRKHKLEPGAVASYYTSMFEVFKLGEVTKEQLLDAYLVCSEYLDKGRSTAKEKYHKLYDDAKVTVDEYFVLVAKCEDIEKIAEKKYNEAPDDVENIKKLSRILAKRECTDGQIFQNVAKRLNELEPSHESAYALSISLLKAGKYSDAFKYAKQAIDLYGDQQGAEMKDYLMVTATAALANGQAAQANNYARKVLKLEPNSGKAYLIIGDAIASSANSCGENEFQKAAVYWLAVDYYNTAKSKDANVAEAANGKIRAYKARFPDKKMMFQYGYIGDGGVVKKESVEIGCWINESVNPRL